jgi:sugar lactone lactonase YvrE
MPFLAMCVIFLMITMAVAQENPPSRIQVRGENRNPEGLECDFPAQRFLLSSLAEGTVYAVDYEGNATPFIEDQNLVMSVGLQIDTENNRLLVVNADSDEGETAGLGIYDLTTGERQHLVDLSAIAVDYEHFPNDVAIDAEGTAYVTDSLAPVIYKVDIEGNASLLLEDERLLIEGFGGNGIVYHPDNYLLVGISGVELYRIPLDAPEDLSTVETRVTISADGMLLDEENNLIVVSQGSVMKLSSEDDWVSASRIANVTRHPAATAAFCGEDVFVIHPQSNAIVRVDFP